MAGIRERERLEPTLRPGGKYDGAAKRSEESYRIVLWMQKRNHHFAPELSIYVPIDYSSGENPWALKCAHQAASSYSVFLRPLVVFNGTPTLSSSASFSSGKTTASSSKPSAHRLLQKLVMDRCSNNRSGHSFPSLTTSLSSLHFLLVYNTAHRILSAQCATVFLHAICISPAEGKEPLALQPPAIIFSTGRQHFASWK